MLMKTKSQLNGIHLDGYDFTWGIIDTCRVGKGIFHLLENEEYGDEAAYIVTDSELNVILDDAYNGFDDLLYFLETDDAILDNL